MIDKTLAEILALAGIRHERYERTDATGKRKLTKNGKLIGYYTAFEAWEQLDDIQAKARALSDAGVSSPSNEVLIQTSHEDQQRHPAGLFVYARDLFDALDLCIEQMAQCEKLLSDDREFTAALSAARAARSKAGGE